MDNWRRRGAWLGRGRRFGTRSLLMRHVCQARGVRLVEFPLAAFRSFSARVGSNPRRAVVKSYRANRAGAQPYAGAKEHELSPQLGTFAVERIEIGTQLMAGHPARGLDLQHAFTRDTIEPCPLFHRLVSHPAFLSECGAAPGGFDCAFYGCHVAEFTTKSCSTSTTDS
jgi:hypothetical protein